LRAKTEELSAKPFCIFSNKISLTIINKIIAKIKNIKEIPEKETSFIKN